MLQHDRQSYKVILTLCTPTALKIFHAVVLSVFSTLTSHSDYVYVFKFITEDGQRKTPMTTRTNASTNSPSGKSLIITPKSNGN